MERSKRGACGQWLQAEAPLIATILCVTIAGLGLLRVAGDHLVGATRTSLDATCPATNTAGMFACDGGSAAHRRSYDISGAEQVRRLRTVSSCEFTRIPTATDQVPWPPPEPMVMELPGWNAERFRHNAFLERFKEWRWPLSTFLRLDRV
ncbi:unnamed protein product [Durusdinium trenchii]|uniref:Uncharacterized protein n=1 Tax=Durusdinium trenchii TaxID=1381693 RepID=A0ABP0K187_9DINO